MSSIALDIRDHPDLTDDLADDHDDGGDDAGPAVDHRADARADAGADEAHGPGPAARPATPVPTRLRCAACGTVLTVDEAPQAAWQIPVHAVGLGSADPFTVRACPGSGGPADSEADAVPAPAPLPPAAPARSLPSDLHWRDQPFSHATV